MCKPSGWGLLFCFLFESPAVMGMALFVNSDNATGKVFALRGLYAGRHSLLHIFLHSLLPSQGAMHLICKETHACVNNPVPLVTHLLESQDNGSILDIINRFSSFLCLIPLPILPTAFETANNFQSCAPVFWYPKD